MHKTVVGTPTIGQLDNPVRPYGWGSRTTIPELLGRPPTGQPQAELWMGAHPGSPSTVRTRAGVIPLPDLLADDPVGQLGPAVVAEFGPRLPFLLKIIAADAPLSLQAHPDARQAREGYADEEARGVPLDAPDRNYKDPHHKPELIVALTAFDALCGFRKVDGTVRLLDVLLAAGAADPLGPYVRALQARPDRDGLREVVTRLLTLPEDRRQDLVGPVAAACRVALADGTAHGGGVTAELRCALELADRYPGDVGVALALLLNLIRLEPGEAAFMPAGAPHAYLRGTGVEILAGSDNVLRGGLTPKHVDVPELLRVLDVADGPAPLVSPRPDGAELVYDTPVADFRLSRVDVASGSVTLPAGGPQILLVVDGGVAATDPAGTEVPLARGASLWVPATVPVTLTGAGVVFRATVPAAAADSAD